MHTWGVSYSSKEDNLILYHEKWWTRIVESFGVPLIRYGFTYSLGNWIIWRAERGRKEVYQLPLPEDLKLEWDEDE